MEYFLYSVELPFSKIKLFYRELNSKEQLILCKANTTLPLEENYSVDYALILFDIISSCVKNKLDLKKINIIDYILFVSKLRIASLGDSIELEFSSPQKDTDIEKIKLQLYLEKFMWNLFQNTKDSFTEPLEYKEWKINLDWPLAIHEESLLSSQEAQNNVLEKILDSLPLYVKSIELDNKIINFSDFDINQKVLLYEKIPIQLHRKIHDKVIGAVQNISKANLFELHKPEYGMFNFYNNSHQIYLRLFFTGSLQSIYQEYYILASKNIPPSYIDNLTIGERKLFFSYTEQESRANSDENNSTQSPHSRDVVNLAREFGENVSN